MLDIWYIAAMPQLDFTEHGLYSNFNVVLLCNNSLLFCAK